MLKPKTRPFLMPGISCLVVFLWLMPGLQAQCQMEVPAEYDRLNTQFHEAYQAGDIEKALACAEKMHDAVQQNYIHAVYNVACMNCKLGQMEEAYTWLDKAAAAGYNDVAYMLKDEDLAPLRDDERFKKLARKVWSTGYISMLERDERVDFQKPVEVMTALDFQAGERVADVGAGSGYFTLPVSRAVGPKGKVWATDIFQDMLNHIDKRLRAEKVQNVELVKAERDDPCLPQGAVDTVLMVDVYHYIQDKTAYARKLKECLAPGGRVVVIDYIPKTMEERPWGPHPEQQFSKTELDAFMAEAGFKPRKTHDFLSEQFFVEYGID